MSFVCSGKKIAMTRLFRALDSIQNNESSAPAWQFWHKKKRITAKICASLRSELPQIFGSLFTLQVSGAELTLF